MGAPASLAQLAESYFDLRWNLDPVEASGAGVAAHDARLGSFVEESVRQHVAALRALQGAMEELELDDLQDEIDRTALLNDARVLVHRLTREAPQRRDPAFWVSHALEGLYQMLVARDRSTERRADAARARLEALPGFLDEARATLRDCPRVFVETGREVTLAGLPLVDEVRLALPGAEPGWLDAPAAAARGALEAFAAELEAMLERAPVAGYAAGEDALNFRLSYQHALQATATEALRYGRRLVDEVEADLAQRARRLAPGTPWPDLAERLREEHPPADGLVSAYAAAMERARAFVEAHRLVTVPDGALEVVATPGYLLPVIPFAAYLPPGALSSDRTGRFFVSLPDEREGEDALRDHCRHEIPATALHEGYPGHHLHFLAAQAQPRPVRRLLYSPLTVEGWALYSEELMDEEGFYQAEEERFFQRVALLWRALRIVLDVGLHTGVLPYAEGVRLARERMGFSAEHAEAEVRRACAEPAYQMAYALGRRELKALREAYRRAAGAEFSLRRFHDTAMAYGGLPVSLMRWGMGLDG